MNWFTSYWLILSNTMANCLKKFQSSHWTLSSTLETGDCLFSSRSQHRSFTRMDWFIDGYAALLPHIFLTYSTSLFVAIAIGWEIWMLWRHSSLCIVSWSIPNPLTRYSNMRSTEEKHLSCQIKLICIINSLIKKMHEFMGKCVVIHWQRVAKLLLTHWNMMNIMCLPWATEQ